MIETRDVGMVNELVQRDFPDCDMAEILAEPQHICLVEGRSGAVFAFRGPGIYEAHLFYAVRGRDALDLGSRMLAHMRKEHGGRLFWAAIPVESRKVAMFTRLMGWKSLGSREMRAGLNEIFVFGECECLQRS